MSRTSQITQIINKRQPLTKNIEKTEVNLNRIAYRLSHLEEHRQSLLNKVDEPNIIGRLKEIDFSKIQQDIASELQALNKLKRRFSRDTLNIGVIGRARQGKSRLLQSLTGLSKAEIPDGSGQHCTGVRSTIHHNPNMSIYGEVFFYTERSFIDEVISPYYEELKLGIKPINIDNFASQELPSLPNDTKGAEVNAKYEHLRQYYKQVDQYRSLLKSPSPRQITKEEIREYVAQDNEKGERIYFNYLAVREVKITCNFPKDDVGKIALVDMPGLGDTGIGDEKRMVKTIGEDIDVVLFVRMPKAFGDFWGDVDVQLYDTAYSALNDLPVELWSFMVLNKLNDENNLTQCESLKGDITNKYIKVVDCVIANCADSQEANNQVLDPILNYLTNNITDLDRQYASACQDRLKQLQTSVIAELEKSQNALGKGNSSTDMSEFLLLFDKFWDDLTNGLENLLTQLSQQINDQDQDFKKSVNKALKTCEEDTKIPSSLEEIETRRNNKGSYNSAYSDYLNEIRAHLSQHFLSLDNGLKQSLDRVKSQVVDVLINKVNLGGITEAQGVNFLSAIAKRLTDEDQLRFGFNILSEFELSYRGTIQHRIRQCLNGLTPDKTNLNLSKQSPNAKEIMSNLKVLHQEAVFQCETALEDFLCEPSQAGFAIVEEFLDRVLRAENVKREWQNFLYKERAYIWPKEFELLGERSRLRQEWLEAVQEATKANQQDFIQFIN
ncbi:hypothetical protein [Aphanothece sacrum]|uniref:Dynamin family protein n=1 Tax=Aphanothece sacrum FPU1 TaxID=1920663 RepID=A0A401IJM8_APHSA|nr:hypothetical protein [Aphanothece sacrum]GBF81487.1 dynamin family protein [Aphanothece sacrum FPU1]GBF86412.1 dynamin family protein [Aphanothece sacrum FPU3]